jgi:Rps23 Pro-64 3,4-dihydroxylase Tpa1-like proline 4-hydroxylase
MIDLTRLNPQALAREPYRWAFIDQLFSPSDSETLVQTFPRDHFKTVKGYDGEKGYEYEARSLIGMDAFAASHRQFLSLAWQQLTDDILSPAYRTAISRLTGLDLTGIPMEANVFHYGPRAWLGPHVDLEDKIVSHIFYFNDFWNEENGGCLHILRASDVEQVAARIPPLIGNSAILVRSQNSWHTVSRVREGQRLSRRSMTVTFYRPGSLSTMWPQGDSTPLHRYGDKTFLLGRWLREKWSQVAS